jgi:hypothetical protein
MRSLPAGELIVTGLRDLHEQRETIASLLVSIGAPKLRSLGLDVPEASSCYGSTPEHRLYDLLASDDSDSAHSRYNALIRKLVSFERALSCLPKEKLKLLCVSSGIN